MDAFSSLADEQLAVASADLAALLAVVAGRDATLKPFCEGVVVVGGEHRLRERRRICDDWGDLFVDQLVLVLVDRLCAVESKVAFDGGVHPRDVEFAVKDEHTDLGSIEGLVGWNCIRTSPLRLRFKGPSFWFGAGLSLRVVVDSSGGSH